MSGTPRVKVNSFVLQSKPTTTDLRVGRFLCIAHLEPIFDYNSALVRLKRATGTLLADNETENH